MIKRKIHLYGDLAEKFGKVHEYAVNSIGEAIRAIEANFPGFRNHIKRDAEYYVVNGDEFDTGYGMDKESIFMEYKKGDFHICPVIGGGKNSSATFAVILGVILMVVSIWVPPAGVLGMKLITGGLVFSMGLGLVLTGVMGMLTPVPQVPEYGKRETPEERPSFLFDGPVNTVAQGGPVPLIFGELIVGSTIVSTALDVEDI